MPLRLRALLGPKPERVWKRFSRAFGPGMEGTRRHLYGLAFQGPDHRERYTFTREFLSENF